MIDQKHMLKRKFFDAARVEFPTAGEPGACWVLTHVLGWSWEEIQNTSVEGFSRHGYIKFVRDENGMVKEKVSRRWDKNQKAMLREWWWLLGL